MSKQTNNPSIAHIAQLSNLQVSQQDEPKFAQAFKETLKVVDELNEIDTKKIEPTSQVTGLTNVWREDTVRSEDQFTQDEALANAAKSHDGYFLVDLVLKEAA